nr:unnamed protein product [Callosobruchus chinensis]
MSDQQPTSSPNPPTCDETEAWCNMISCIYSFLTSSTNLAAILEANYISTIQEPQVKQQLYLLPPPNPEFHLSDFPWFLDILFGAHRDNQSYSSQKSNKISPSMVSYNNHSNIGDCNELERVLESMHQMQETFLQSYDRVQGSYDTRYVLTSQCPVNCYIQYEADLTSVTEPEDNFQTAVSQEPDEITNSIQLNHSSDQDLEIAEETVEPSYVEESSSLSDTPANIEQGLKSSSKEDMINVKDNVSDETYFDEYTESNHTVNLPDSKYVSLVNVSDENSARLQLDQQVSSRLTRNDLFQTLGDFRDVMKSEEIQTVVNKRYNCTLKALITRSAEQQMPWEEVLPKTLEKPRPSLENLHATAAAEEKPVFVNQIEKLEDKQDQEEQDPKVNKDTVEKNLKNVQIEKHEDEQDQIEHESVCSEIPRAAKHLIKILSQDLNVNKDTDEKNLKNVQIEKHEDEQDQEEHEAACSEITRAAKHLIKILSQDLEVNEDIDEKNLKNIVKHEDEQDQEEHQRAFSKIPSAKKHPMKIPSQDLKVTKDTDGKNLKNVQRSTKNLSVKHSMVKLVNVQMTPEVKGSNEKVAKQLSKNTGPKLKPRNPIAVKKESQQIKDMKPSSSKNMPLQKPTGKDEQGITKLIMPKRVIPKQYASIESTVRRFIQDGLKSTAKPKDNTISRKPVHPNEMKALQHSLDKAKSKAEAVAIHKNLSSQPVLIPKQMPNKGGSKVSPSAPTQKPNLKSQSVVLGSTSKMTSRYIPKSSMIQHKHGEGTIADTKVQRKPPVRGGGNLKAKTDLMSKKIDTSLKSKTDTDMPSKKPEKASKSQENRAAKKIALSTVKKTR